MTNFIRFLKILFLRLQNAKKSKAKAKSILRKRIMKKSPTFKKFKNNKSKKLNENNFPSVQFEIEWNITVGDVERRRSTLLGQPS